MTDAIKITDLCDGQRVHIAGVIIAILDACGGSRVAVQIEDWEGDKTNRIFHTKQITLAEPRPLAGGDKVAHKLFEWSGIIIAVDGPVAWVRTPNGRKQAGLMELERKP